MQKKEEKNEVQLNKLNKLNINKKNLSFYFKTNFFFFLNYMNLKVMEFAEKGQLIDWDEDNNKWAICNSSKPS